MLQENIRVWKEMLQKKAQVKADKGDRQQKQHIGDGDRK